MPYERNTNCFAALFSTVKWFALRFWYYGKRIMDLDQYLEIMNANNWAYLNPPNTSLSFICQHQMLMWTSYLPTESRPVHNRQSFIHFHHYFASPIIVSFYMAI